MHRFMLNATIFALVTMNVAGARDICAEDPAARFLNEAPKAWVEYERLFDQLQGTLTLESKLVTQGTRTYERGVIRYVRSGECRLAELVSRVTGPEGPRMPLELHGINRRYGFRLSRSAADDPWQLKEVYYDMDARRADRPIWLFRRTLDNVSPATLLGKPLSALVRREGFRVERARRMADGRVRVDFVVNSDASRQQLNEKKSAIKSGQLVLDPRRRWTLDSARFVTALGAKEIATTEVAFSFRKDARYIPSRVNFTFIATDKRRTSGTMTYDCALELPETPAAADRFTLRAFGFAEPDAAARGK